MGESPDEKGFSEELGSAIRARREQIGMSQTELARLAKFHRNWVGRVERGQVNLTVWCLLRIASALDTTPSNLLRKTGQ